MEKILHIVGSRSNFMKVAPVMSALSEYGVSQLMVYTGQYYDADISDVFLRQLGLPEPNANLGVGSDSQAVHTAHIMMKLEEMLLLEEPDLVLVYGDVNSTVAAALVCSKLIIPLGHVEAGLRSGDRMMPEEINRIVTDQIADLLFTPSEDSNKNLAREGIPKEKIHFVGNVMIDTLIRLQERASEEFPLSKMAKLNHLDADSLDGGYALVTLHRPANVEAPTMLLWIMRTLKYLSRELKIIFPIYPQVRKRLHDLYFNTEDGVGLFLTEPMGYLEFLSLQKNATVVITDSGVIQEETTLLGVPCLTLRENTERPVTVRCGSNKLVGHDMYKLTAEVRRILAGNPKKGSIPRLWDGMAGKRIANIIVESEGGRRSLAPKLSPLRLHRKQKVFYAA